MAYSLLWWPDADEAMTRLEHDQGLSAPLRALQRTLGRLETDPFSPERRTRQFVSDKFGHIRATPAGHEDWYVFWQLGGAPTTIEIVQVAELTL